jgi:hypothetical protein
MSAPVPSRTSPRVFFHQNPHVKYEIVDNKCIIITQFKFIEPGTCVLGFKNYDILRNKNIISTVYLLNPLCEDARLANEKFTIKFDAEIEVMDTELDLVKAKLPEDAPEPKLMMQIELPPQRAIIAIMLRYSDVVDAKIIQENSEAKDFVPLPTADTKYWEDVKESLDIFIANENREENREGESIRESIRESNEENEEDEEDTIGESSNERD